MSDPRPAPGIGWVIAGAVGSLLVLSLLLPAALALSGALASAPFFGVQPSDVQRAASATSLWEAFGAALVSVIVVIVLAVANRHRAGGSALTVLAVLAVVVAGVWLIVAASVQQKPGSSSSAIVGSDSPSAAPTTAFGRTIPDERGTTDASALVMRLKTAVFPADAGPDSVQQIVAGAGADSPEVRGRNGDVVVGVFVGHQTCVLGEVRAGHPIWSVVGVSTDGGCLGPDHG